jgi:hypothetical protein
MDAADASALFKVNKVSFSARSRELRPSKKIWLGPRQSYFSDCEF